jgi:quinol monooxygenase YgiN
MTLDPESVAPFLTLFDRVSSKIRTQSGCQSLVLLRDRRFPNIVSTYSVWDDEEKLDRYRSSSLFRETWAETKGYFAAPAEAWSHDILRGDPRVNAVRSSG